jgi:xylulokinase
MLNSLGTAEAIFLPTAEPLSDPLVGRQGYTQGAHVTGGGYYAFAGQYTSGASVDWLRRLLGSENDPLAYEAMIAGAKAVPVGSLGAMFLPHLRLANPPYEDPRSRGALIGLTTEIGSHAVARALLEGLAFESLSTFEPLLAYPQIVPPTSVVAIGGGTRNSLLMKIKASLTNLPHEVIDAEEATALGAAILGGLGAGVYESVDEARSEMRYGHRVVMPTSEDVQQYRALYDEVYRRFYPAVAPLSQTISDMQTSALTSTDI